MSFELPDSGTREHFSTGSRRDCRTGKGRWDLLPWESIERIAIHTENGALKYGDRNWEKGQPISRFLDSAISHITKYAQGRNEEDHLAAACWNLLAIMHHQHHIKLGNLPTELGEKNDLTTTWGTNQPQPEKQNEQHQDHQEGEAFTSYITS